MFPDECSGSVPCPKNTLTHTHNKLEEPGIEPLTLQLADVLIDHSNPSYDAGYLKK